MGTGPVDEIATVLVSMAWVLYNLIIIGGAVGVAAEVRQVRRAHRVATNLPASIGLPDGHRYPCELHDYADGGVGVVLPKPGLVALDTPLTLFLRRGPRDRPPPRVADDPLRHVRRRGHRLRPHRPARGHLLPAGCAWRPPTHPPPDPAKSANKQSTKAFMRALYVKRKRHDLRLRKVLPSSATPDAGQRR